MQTARYFLQSVVCLLQVFLFRESKLQTLMGKKQLPVSCSHHFERTYHYPVVNLMTEQHRTLKEKHHSSSDKSIVHQNVDDKQKIVFILLEGILTSTSRDLRMQFLILVYNNGGTHTKSFPLPHSIRFLQLAPRTVLHMNYPTGTPNTLEVDLP